LTISGHLSQTARRTSSGSLNRGFLRNGCNGGHLSSIDIIILVGTSLDVIKAGWRWLLLGNGKEMVVSWKDTDSIQLSQQLEVHDLVYVAGASSRFPKY
jgi:hypothetical protein